MYLKNLSSLFILALFIFSCSSPYLKYEKMEQLRVDDELPVDVKELPAEKQANSSGSSSSKNPVPETDSKITGHDNNISTASKKEKNKIKNSLKGSIKSSSEKAQQASNLKNKKTKKSSIEKTSEVDNAVVEPNLRRLPEFENNVGFPPGSRRPYKDPFRVGEKVTLLVSYFKAKAGEMTLEIKPFVEVNGHKSYRWYTSLKTIGVFSSFYSVDDWSETMADFETLVPSVFNLNVRESSQLKQAKGYFDNQTLKARFYEKKYTEKKGQEEKRQEWITLPFSQNVFSAAFYMRTFTYEVGKEYGFNVADDEKNVMFKAKCLRKEKLETDAGTFDTIVIQPNFEINGVFKPMGEILFWLTDDDRKLLVRIESDIKIGTIIADAISIERGQN
jgi:hypothetical protein